MYIVGCGVIIWGIKVNLAERVNVNKSHAPNTHWVTKFGVLYYIVIIYNPYIQVNFLIVTVLCMCNANLNSANKWFWYFSS